MLLEKALWILAFTVVSLTSEVYGLDWPWNWTKEDVTCYSTCLAAVGTGAVVGTPLAIAAAGFGTAGVVVGSVAAKIMSMIGVVPAGGWFAYLQAAGVLGVGTTGKMILASTVAPLCAAICGSSEERQGSYYIKNKTDDSYCRRYDNGEINNCNYQQLGLKMLLDKAVFIISFSVVSFNSGVYGLDWPWNWKVEDVTCYTTCLAAVGTGAVVGTPFAISAAGFGAAGVAAGSVAAKVMSMIGVVQTGGWFAFFQSVGVTGVGATGKMVLASTVSPMCAAICGSSEEIQDLKCNTHIINGTKGLDENVIKAEIVDNKAKCEGLCNDQTDCKAFRYLPKNRVCFVYNSNQHIEDDVSESEFYVKRCVLCYMNTTKNAKGRDDEIESITKESSIKECVKYCIKSDDCIAVHFDGERCFKFTDQIKPYTKTGIDFSRKICKQFMD